MGCSVQPRQGRKQHQGDDRRLRDHLCGMDRELLVALTTQTPVDSGELEENHAGARGMGVVQQLECSSVVEVIPRQ